MIAAQHEAVLPTWAPEDPRPQSLGLYTVGGVEVALAPVCMRTIKTDLTLKGQHHTTVGRHLITYDTTSYQYGDL